MGIDTLLATFGDTAPAAKVRRKDAEDVAMHMLDVDSVTSIYDIPTEIILKVYNSHFASLSHASITFIALLDVLNASVPVDRISYTIARARDMLFAQVFGAP